MLFKLSNLNSNLALTPGYLNPALNNSAQLVIIKNFLPQDQLSMRVILHLTLTRITSVIKNHSLGKWSLKLPSTSPFRTLTH